jgi:hypothetical protein
MSDWCSCRTRPRRAERRGTRHEALVLDSYLPERQLLVIYRRGHRLTGVLTAGGSHRAERTWRALVASGVAGEAAVTDTEVRRHR